MPSKAPGGLAAGAVRARRPAGVRGRRPWLASRAG